MSFLSKSVSVPIIGNVSLPIALGAGVLIYFLLFRKKRVTSITTRYAK